MKPIPEGVSPITPYLSVKNAAEAIEFYKHKHNWSNRLIAGDSLLVMNSCSKKREWPARCRWFISTRLTQRSKPERPCLP